MILDVYHFGALRVLVDQATGEVMGVQDRISGEAASLRYSNDYINQARHFASLAHSSLLSEA